MKANKDNIQINHIFIESDLDTFIGLYDLSLTRFMNAWRFYNFKSLTHTIDPKHITDIEKEFIKTTLKFLKERRMESKKIFRKVYCDFLEENTITEEKFNENYDNGICEKFSDYQYKKVSKKVMGEEISFYMKIDFLLLKANKLNCIIDLEDDFKFEKREIPTFEEPIDLSHTKATEKIIYLNELGIIEHLMKIEPFKHSVNKLATVLSAISDEKTSTLQPKLNAMLSEHTNAPQNDPYSSRTKVGQIKQSLIKIGFNIDD